MTYSLTIQKPWILIFQEYVAGLFTPKRTKVKEKEYQPPVLTNPSIIIGKISKEIDCFLLLYNKSPETVKKNFSNLSQYISERGNISEEDMYALCFGKSITSQNTTGLSAIVNECPLTDSDELGIQRLIQIKYSLNELNLHLNEKPSNLLTFYRNKKIPLKELSNVLYGNIWDLKPSNN